MPGHLGEDAQKEWKRLVKELGAMRLLTSADSDALAMYCQTYERWVAASKKLAAEGMVTFTEKGYPVMSPYIAIVNQCIKTMQRLLTEFGMTPASRARIQVPEKKEADPFDDFLRRR
jgi:P27 family predicted phage terminase small subunit